MGRLRIRCLGGLEVWRGDRPLTGFESQKVRGLLVYLACQHERPFSRDHLAELLWPDSDPERARRNLRQALYNLKTTLSDGEAAVPLDVQASGVRFTRDELCWLDVEAFEEATRRGHGDEGAGDLHHLTRAAQLYRGDFLTDFSLRDSPMFEEWLITEQERLRNLAITTLRSLVDIYLARGEFRYGTQYALRLVTIDPLSEEAHRQLMRLYAFSGQRGRALTQYERLQELLTRELGVEPLEESRQLYETILVQPSALSPTVEEEEPIGPFIPLVGRGPAYAELRRCWGAVLAGEGRLTLVEGEEGIGKTRLIKSFLDSATSQRRASVLKGRSYELSPRRSYRPFSELLTGLFSGGLPGTQEALAQVPREDLVALARLVARNHRPPGLAVPAGDELEGSRLTTALCHLLAALTQAGEEASDPLILFLDDLQWADPASLELLAALVPRLDGLPVWIVASSRPPEVAPAHPLARLREGQVAGAVVDRIPLTRLAGTEVAEIAVALLGDEREAAELAAYLSCAGAGLPLCIAELINALWDQRTLVARSPTRWQLTQPLEEADLPSEPDLDELILERVRQLPTSTRRLVSLAAIIGQCFEADLLQRAAGEHRAVVEVGLELMLGRWLARQFATEWSDQRRQQDIVLWAGGARRGAFEFAHPRVRRAIYQDINPLRRQVMHGEVAQALVEQQGGEADQMAEALAFHFRLGQRWEPAQRYLELAARRAQGLGDMEAATAFLCEEREVLSRLMGQGTASEERWRARRERVEEALSMLAAV